MSLEKFANEHDSDFTLETIDAEQKKCLLNQCLRILQTNEQTELTECLRSLRILTRDDISVDKLKNDVTVDRLIFHAFPTEVTLPDRCIVEALKTLSNILFKRPCVLAHFKSVGIVQKLIDRLEIHSKMPSRNDIILLDLKLMFLMSGLDPATRQELADGTDVFHVLADLLSAIQSSSLSTRECILISELLKVAYNIGYCAQRNSSNLEVHLAVFNRYGEILRNLLLRVTDSSPEHHQLLSQIVNFLNVLPRRCFKQLISNKNSSDIHEMTPIQVLLDFLETELSPVDIATHLSVTGLEERLCPVLTALTRASQSSRDIRKYCRAKILPHLSSEVRSLPEEGLTIRNRLCRLLTNPSQGVSEIVALFLFVLCKEDISRAVKYTGFGNFAGFLARHALLGGASKKKARSLSVTGTSTSDQKGDTGGVDDSAEEYSSASSDSETEEYKRLKDEVNPVTGRWEAPQINPMEGMTEEQKEYFAMELVNKIDQLQRGGIIQPGRVEEGRVKPVQHVLELLKDVKNIPENEHSSDSD